MNSPHPTPYRNYIAGDWRAGQATFRNVNPSDLSDVIGEYAEGSAADAAEAVDAAKAALPGWAGATIQQRSDCLDKAGNEILARKEELGRLLSREEGKTLLEGIGEAARAGQIFKWFAGEALRLSGDRVGSVRPGIEVETTREPLGIVALITPWNFPLAIPAWKIAPALAYGNTVVLKPAALVPGSAWAIAEILSRAGLPPGVFNLVMGPGRSVGQALLDNPGVNGVSFTGSVDTGRQVAQYAAAHLTRVQLEMGGKNPLIVLDDADLEIAAECAFQGAFMSTGQRCTASSRLIVGEDIHDRFVGVLTEKLKAARVGDALQPDTKIGPVVDQKQLDQDLFYIDLGKREGGRLVFGGERLNRETEGFFLSPALFTETTNQMRLNREEVFGPVAAVIRVRNYDEALTVANDTPFGLTAGICTRSLKHASHFKRHTESGMVMVNLPTAGVDYHVPFGGRKGSSYGSREQGSYAREFYTIVKTAYTAP
jgi:alpha-ketoglutaric semialdehyde dehydrogenase